jgi:hypothetical protein
VAGAGGEGHGGAKVREDEWESKGWGGALPTRGSRPPVCRGCRTLEQAGI